MAIRPAGTLGISIATTALLLAAATCTSCRARETYRDGTAASTESTREDWPSLPVGSAAAAALVEARTLRPPPAALPSPIDAPLLLARLERPGPAGLVAGEDAVRRRLQAFLDEAAGAGRDAWLLWGVRHDSGGQLDAFRRLLGPGGLRGLDVAAAENFFATGRWLAAAAGMQTGDDDDIRTWLDRGDRAAFERLAARHPDSDYAAWKSGTTANALDLLVEARAVGLDFRGCNMPRGLQEGTGLTPLGDDGLRLRLRELHCLLALGRATGPRSAAVLWGADHVLPDGFPRFLPADAAVLAVTVFGFRPGSDTMEEAVARTVMVTDPVLVPLDDAGTQLGLLLPDPVLGGDIERVRVDEPSADSSRVGVWISSAVPGRMRVAGRVEEAALAERRLELPEGEYAYVLEAGELRVVGRLAVRAGTSLELTFDPAERFLSWREQPVRP